MTQLSQVLNFLGYKDLGYEVIRWYMFLLH